MRYDIWLKYEDKKVAAMVIPKHRADDMYVFIDMIHDSDENVRYERLCTVDDILLKQINDQIRNQNFALR